MNPYIKCASTCSLTQHSPGNSMEDWFANFGVQIGFEAFASP